MNTQTVVHGASSESTGSVAQDVTVPVKAKLTKEACFQKSDDELLQMVKKAQGHTGTDFGTFMNCDFSYSYLTKLLRDRGWENGWHKVREDTITVQKPELILMKKSAEAVGRQSFMLEKSIAEEWRLFNKNVPYKSVTLGHALRRFMEDVRSGKIKFELEI